MAKELLNKDPEELKPCLQRAEKRRRERKLRYAIPAGDRAAACKAWVIPTALSPNVDTWKAAWIMQDKVRRRRVVQSPSTCCAHTRSV